MLIRGRRSGCLRTSGYGMLRVEEWGGGAGKDAPTTSYSLPLTLESIRFQGPFAPWKQLLNCPSAPTAGLFFCSFHQATLWKVSETYCGQSVSWWRVDVSWARQEGDSVLHHL